MATAAYFIHQLNQQAAGFIKTFICLGVKQIFLPSSKTQLVKSLPFHMPYAICQTSIFGVVFFVFESLLGIERQKKFKKFTILTRKPRSHVRILIYRTWSISIDFTIFFSVYCLVFVSIEKIYQKLETLFHQLSKHLEFRQKYSATRRISTLFSAFGYPDETLSLVFDILSENILLLGIIADE